jgi:hypothetical protein
MKLLTISANFFLDISLLLVCDGKNELPQNRGTMNRSL